MTSGQISLRFDLTYAPSTITSQNQLNVNWIYCSKLCIDDHIGGQPLAAPRTTPAALAPQVLQTPIASTTTTVSTPTPTNSSRKLQIFYTLH
ncbi:hypothetical protein Tco_0520548 [Tanacetum coccineum]